MHPYAGITPDQVQGVVGMVGRVSGQTANLSARFTQLPLRDAPRLYRPETGLRSAGSTPSY